MIFSIWLTAVAIQVVIAILLTLQFFRPSKKRNDTTRSFSIIIAAHNELENLKILIPGLIGQAHSDFEIIVVLDRSTDKSEAFLEGLNCDKLKIVSIEKTAPGYDSKKYALSRAIEVAENEWLVFTDADCHPSSDRWLHQIESMADERTSIILGYSPYRNHGRFIHYFIQFEGFLTAFNYLSMARLGKPYMGVGRNMAVRRTFFHESGGYNSFKSITGGDDDLFIQTNATSKNTEIVMGKGALVHSYPKNSIKDYLKQKMRHLSVGGSYSFSDQFFHFVFNTTNLLTWLLIPFLSLQIVLPIILFYLSVKVIGYRFAAGKMGAGFNYILLPLVDLIYAVFIPIIAIRSKLVKDIRWKN
ncbi:MAG: glycosyltransferase [Cyclobacteriaceae bacterium]